MATIFVSGHLDLKWEEFEEHYAPKLRAAAEAGHSFVVGDAPGADFQAQRFLREECGVPKDRVTVFHMLDYPRHSYGSGYGTRDPNTQAVLKSRPATARGGYPLKGGFQSDEERDAAMTAASDDDIAWVRPSGSKRHSSGTASNLRRRADVRLERDRAGRRAHPRFVIEHDWAEYPIIRVKTPSPDMLEPSHRYYGTLVPIPPELMDRYAQALARQRAASQEVSNIEQVIRSLEAQQETDPV